jgi:hypothetical protein
MRAYGVIDGRHRRRQSHAECAARVDQRVFSTSTWADPIVAQIIGLSRGDATIAAVGEGDRGGAGGADRRDLRGGHGSGPPREDNGAPDRIRTCDLRLRRPTLYPLSYRRAGANDTGRPG